MALQEKTVLSPVLWVWGFYRDSHRFFCGYGMSARSMGEGEALAPTWKCWKVFFLLQMLSKFSVYEVFMHRFEKMSSTSAGFALRPPPGSCPWTLLDAFCPSDPLIAHPWKISCGRLWGMEWVWELKSNHAAACVFVARCRVKIMHCLSNSYCCCCNEQHREAVCCRSRGSRCKSIFDDWLATRLLDENLCCQHLFPFVLTHTKTLHL